MPAKRKTFPLKLWQLVNDHRLSTAIRWAEDGNSFFVDEEELRNMCLGKENKVFYTREPKSFIRQLHLYGFKKINKNQFKHPDFQRDKPHLVKDIKRSYRTNPNVLERIEGIDTDNLIENNNFSLSTGQTFMPSSICSLCVCAGCSGF